MNAVERAAVILRQSGDQRNNNQRHIEETMRQAQALAAAGLLATEEHDRKIKAEALRWAADHLSDGMSYDDIDAINSWAAVVVCSGIIRKRADQIEAGDHDGE